MICPRGRSGALKPPSFKAQIVRPSTAMRKSHSRRSQPTLSQADLLPFKVAVFSTSEYVMDFLQEPLESNFSKVKFLESRLDEDTAELAKGYDAVCLFVNDACDEEAIRTLAEGGVRYIAMRCAGYDRVDLRAAERHGVRVVRVPSYSPRSVAEMALTLMMAAARNLHLATQKVAIGNYAVDGLVGKEVSFKTYGIIGTGKIGVELIKLLRGFDGRVLAFDVHESEEAKAAGATYADLETVLRESDVVSLHVPLLPSTRKIINYQNLRLMKKDAILINVSRGGLIDSGALMHFLQHENESEEESGKLFAVGMDVYEKEGSLFFEDFTRLSVRERMKSWDMDFTQLKSMPQVLITPHIAFLTEEALRNISDTTVANLRACANGETLVNEVAPPK